MRARALLLFAALPLAACAMRPEAATATDCPIANVSLAATLRALPGTPSVSESQARDPDSGEPILRTALVHPDATRIVVEQQNCAIENLRVSLAAPQPRDDAQLQRLVETLTATPLWQRHYAASDARAAIAAALPGASPGTPVPLDLPPASGEVSDALLTLEGAPGGAPTGLTLILSVGG